MSGIYVHIPFCKQKCTYCDFASYPKEIGKAEAYVACLIKEIASRGTELKNKKFDTVYFGGGTPSYINAEYIAAIMKKLRSCFCIDEAAEITIEANPGTLTAEKVKIYKDAGFNRFSLGLQSARDERLASLNRIHTAKEFIDSCNLLRGCRLSADVMIGLKDQSLDEIKETIDLALSGGAEHVSVYALKAEEGTPMFTSYLNGELPDDDEVADMYDFARNYLETKGLYRYEVSNFAKIGCESRHNLNYWKRGEYIGLGVAASSCIDDRRFTNTEKIDEYVHCLLHDKYAEIFSEQIEGDERKFEFVMLNMRTTRGVVFTEYKNVFGTEFLNDFDKKVAAERDYLDIDEKRARIKDEFLYVQNQILIKFMD